VVLSPDSISDFLSAYTMMHWKTGALTDLNRLLSLDPSIHRLSCTRTHLPAISTIDRRWPTIIAQSLLHRTHLNITIGRLLSESGKNDLAMADFIRLSPSTRPTPWLIEPGRFIQLANTPALDDFNHALELDPNNSQYFCIALGLQ